MNKNYIDIYDKTKKITKTKMIINIKKGKLLLLLLLTKY